MELSINMSRKYKELDRKCSATRIYVAFIKENGDHTKEIVRTDDQIGIIR